MVAALVVIAGCTGKAVDVTASASASPSAAGAPSPPPTTTTALSSRAAATSATSQPTRTQPTTTQPTTTQPPATSGTTSRRPAPPALNTAADGTCVAGSCYRVGEIHELPDGVAPESSGIAASATVPGAFFVVDDGTGADEIDAVASDGSLLTRLKIAGMSARNAEALSAGPCGSRPGRCLYIGDVGDNDAKRRNITVYRVDEPSLSAPRAGLPADACQYTYPDGPHNAEALLALSNGSLLVLTKSAPDPTTGQVPAHRIYRAPAGGGILTYLSSYRPPEPVAPAQSLVTGTVVTDASYSPGRMLLLTYDEVVEYLAPRAGLDPATFPSWPHHELPAPPMIQSEGITADLTGCGYEVTSEQGPGGSRAGLAGVSCG